MQILRDKCGKLQGVIREIAGQQERLYDSSGNSIATFRRRVNFTYGNDGVRIGSGNRLASMIDQDDE